MGQIFRLKDIYYGIRKHLSVIIAMTVGGLVIGVMIYVLQAFSASNVVNYQIFASFSISTSNTRGIFVNGTDSPGTGDFELADELVPAVAYICRSQKVCGEVVRRTQLLGVQTRAIQRSLSLSQHGETSVMEITLGWGDRDEGMLLLQTVLDVLPGAIQDVLRIGEVEIIEYPTATEITTTVSKSIIVVLTGVGFLIGMLYCLSQLYLHPTLIEIRDVGELFGINMLSDIAEEPEYPTYLDKNLITNRSDLPPGFRESYTALAHIMLHQMEEDHFCLFVTSSARGEGKTTVVCNLGLELAALDKRVLLIDFDLSSPTLVSCFLDEVDYLHSVNAVYFDETSADEAIVRINENLHILPARLDKRHMGINRFAKKLVAQMQEEYDIVLLDTEPVGESSEMLYFSNVSDSALFVIRYDYTPCDQIENCVEKLQKTNTTIHGAIVNRVARIGRGRSGGSDTDGGEKKSILAKFRSVFRKKQANAAAERVAADDDDSDLADDDARAQFLARYDKAQDKRREQAMLRDDEFDENNAIQKEASEKGAPAVRRKAEEGRRKPEDGAAVGNGPAREARKDAGQEDGNGAASEVQGKAARRRRKAEAGAAKAESQPKAEPVSEPLPDFDEDIEIDMPGGDDDDRKKGGSSLTYNDWDNDDF